MNLDKIPENVKEMLESSFVTDEIMEVCFWYPRLEGKIKTIEVSLSDVRAADSIRIEYDFDRDGYSIKQASIFSWEIDDEICDQGWQEVAFIKSWALEK